MKLSIAIVEYHSMPHVRECLQSLDRHLSAIDHEVIVVSNSSYSDQALLDIQTGLGGNARIVSTGGNLGYAGGVNAALRLAEGDYLYILNPDCRLVDDRILAMILVMDADPEIAIMGPRVVDEAGDVQYSCRRFPRPWTFLFVRSILSRLAFTRAERHRYLMSDFDHERMIPVDWVSGGAMLVKMSALKALGGMDERYFLYMEDVDWCRSAWEGGFKVVYCPDSTVIHGGQHRSVKGGIGLILDQHLRWHLSSMLKYLNKHRWRTCPRTAFYRGERAEQQ